MVVKEVLAKKGTRSFGNLASYMLDNKKMPHENSYQFSNCPYEDRDIVQNIQHIINFQSTNQRTGSNKTLHLVVSFAEGERPNKEVLKDIEEQLISSIGLKDHQRFSVVHDNTNNYHIHIAINKIHHETNNIVSPYQSWNKLLKKARELEEQYQLTRDLGKSDKLHQEESLTKKIEFNQNKKELNTDERREQQSRRAKILESSDRAASRQQQTQSINDLRSVSDIPMVHDIKQVKMLLQNNELNNMGFRQTRPDSRVRWTDNGNATDGTRGEQTKEQRIAKDQEIHSGIKNLINWIKEEVLEDLLKIIQDDKSSFDDLQLTLADANLELKARGNGMVIAHKSRNLFVKPSSVHRDLSMGKLEKRYGSLEFKSFNIKPTKMFGLLKHNLWEEYQKDVWEKRVTKKKLFYQAKEANLQNKVAIKEKYNKLIQETKKDLFINRKTKRTIYSNLFERRKNSYKQLSENYKTQRDEIFKSTNQISYKDFLIQKALDGNQTALMVLRATKPIMEKDEKAVVGKTDHKIFITREPMITKQGLVVYRVGESGKIIDKGDRLKITIDNNEEALKEILDMAIAKYGNDLDITGDTDFKLKVLFVAHKYGMKINFKDQTMQEIQKIERDKQQEGKVVQQAKEKKKKTDRGIL